MADVSDDESIDCEGVGDPIYIDDQNFKFYSACQFNGNMTVRIGDCVQVSFKKNEVGYGQILAIFEEPSEEMNVEIRWFFEKYELVQRYDLTPKQQQTKLLKNELIESDIVDDIPVGSVRTTIAIKDHSTSQQKEDCRPCYICRYAMFNDGSDTFHNVRMGLLFERGMSKSHYKYAYREYLQEYAFDGRMDDYSLAIQRLHISVIPENLPCRGVERSEIDEFIRSGVVNGGANRPLYVCGTPGTGKTATVLASIMRLERDARDGKVPQFEFVEINCLRLKAPHDAYSELWKGLSGELVGASTAAKRLKTHFNLAGAQNDYILYRSSSRPVQAKPVTVCLVDELDKLVTQKQEVLYDFFNWPTLQGSNIVIVGIANKMDMMESLKNKNASRSGAMARKIVFQPYKPDQITEILTDRLAALNLDAFTLPIRKLVAFRAGSVAGDLRSALKICQATIELYRDAQQGSDDQLENNLTQRANKIARIAGEFGSDTNVVRKSAEELRDRALQELMRELVSKAVNSYSQSPFIATVSRSVQLDKLILIVMAKYRRQNTSDDAGGESGGDVDRGMTAPDIRERLSELIGIIDNDRTVMKGLAGSYPSSSSSSANSVCSSSSSGATCGATCGAALVDESVAPSLSTVYVCDPPTLVFEQAIQRLCNLGVVTRRLDRIGGTKNAALKLHKAFLFSDLVAALRQDPLSRYCMQTQH